MGKLIKNLALVILVCTAFVSCKSKQAFVETKTPTTVIKNDSLALSSKNIITNHYNNKIDFSTLYIRASAKYKHGDDSQSVTAEIKIKRDEQILVSIRVLGITMAKALITPNEVKYYEKINGEYFEGDYASLSKWLGTDLDFYKVQNMLIGKPTDDLTKGDYVFSETDRFYRLSAKEGSSEKVFSFEAANFLLKKQEISQPEKQRNFEANYPNFQEYALGILPASLTINAFQKSEKTTIIIDYNSITFNEEMNFPYSVPEGYDRIYIKDN